MPILDQFKLDGLTALVTGCRRGIGRAITLGLAEAGANIVGVSSKKDSDRDLAEAVRSLGREYISEACDLSQRIEVHALVKRLEGKQIDILVNNAGSIFRAPVAEHPDEQWDRIIETNLSAQFVLARDLGARMLKRGRGKIIFIASLLSFQGGITVPGYSASKGGIASLIKAFSNEWASRGVNVNGIAPGYIATDNTEALRNDATRNPQILTRIPAGRWGNPDDLAGTAVFLASRASDYVHGEIVTVDGGWMGR